MRCVNCGFPVSPSRSACPRCGTEVNKGGDGRAANAQVAPGAMHSPVGGEQAGWNAGYPGQGQMNPSPFGGDQQMQQPFANNSWPASPSNMPPSGFQSPMYRNGSMQSTGAAGSSPSRSPRLGFTIAGLCVFAGAIILVLVFILNSVLPPSANNNAAQQAPTATTAPTQPSTEATPTSEPTDEAVTPTVTPTDTTQYPASQYIDKAQMATALDENTAKVIQVGDKFKAGDKMYVAFSLHPNKSGAVCLLWYMNDKQFSEYAFETDGTAIPAYSYSITHATGPGYVEIYWASTKACSDKQLAQKVTFTVS